MTEDLQRLVDDPSVPTATRELLRAAGVPAPSREQAQDLWTSIEASIVGPGGPEGGGGGPGTGPAPGAPAPTPTSQLGGGAIATSVLVEKSGSTVLSAWIVMGAGAAVSVALALAVASPNELPPPAPGSLRVMAPRPGDRPVVFVVGDAPPPDLPSIAPSAVAEPSSRSQPNPPAMNAGPARQKEATTSAPTSLESASPVPSASVSPSSVAREEAAATRGARDRLRGGDALGALALLDTATVRFGSGLLGQERTALTVEALGRSGQAQRASALAHQFLARWPSSAHADRVRPWAR